MVSNGWLDRNIKTLVRGCEVHQYTSGLQHSDFKLPVTIFNYHVREMECVHTDSSVNARCRQLITARMLDKLRVRHDDTHLRVLTYRK